MKTETKHTPGPWEMTESVPDVVATGRAAIDAAVFIADDVPSYSVPKREWDAFWSAVSKAEGR